MHELFNDSCAYAQDEGLILIERMLADLPDYYPVFDLPAPDPANAARAAMTLGLLKAPLLRRARAAETWAPVLQRLRERHPAPANDDAPVAMPGSAFPEPTPATSVAPTPAVVVVVPDLVTGPAPQTRRLKPKSGLRQREDARRMRERGRGLDGEAVEHLSPLSHYEEGHKGEGAQPPRATTTIITRHRRGIAAWDIAGELPRLVAVNRALPEFGTPFAFSLNPSPDLIAAANDNPRGALDYLRRQVARHLKRALGQCPPMWVAIETDDDGRPHLHGGLALNDNDDPMNVEAVLARAGGNWTRQGSAPADVRRQWSPDGWAFYPLKRAARTRRHLREAASLPATTKPALVSYSADLRIAGQRLHEEARRAIGRH